MVNVKTEEAMKAKLKELDRLAAFGVYETVDGHLALGKKARDDTLAPGPQKTESKHDSSQESSRVTRRCMTRSRHARLRAEDASSTV